MNIHIPKFKSLLEDEKIRIEKELESISAKVGSGENNIEAIQLEVGEDTADREDVAESIESYENNESIVVALRTELSEIDHALGKINLNNETYGVCEVGGEQIEEDRLEANPSARTCKGHI